MRRRRLWIFVGSALVLAVTAVLMLAFLRVRSPFRFLDGHEPVHEDEFALTYTFQANQASFMRLAKEELLSRGYDLSWEQREREDPFVEFVSPDFPDSGLSLFPAARAAESGSITFMPGWVTVTVGRSDHEQSAWDRIKAVFGL